MAEVNPEVSKPGQTERLSQRSQRPGSKTEGEPRHGRGRPEIGPLAPHFELSFDAAKSLAQIVAPIAEAVREKNEEKLVIVSPAEIAAIKQILVEVGLDPARLNHMPSFEIVALGHGLLLGAKGKDLEAKVLIEKARDTDHEALTSSQVRKYMRVEELVEGFGKEAKGGGPGAEAVEGEAGEEEVREPAIPDIREIIAQMKILVKDGRHVETNARWVELSRQLQTAIDSFNRAVEAKRFLEVYEFVRAIEDAEYLTEKPLTGDPTREKEALDTILSEERRNQFKKASDNLDSEFQTLYDKLDNKQRGIVFKDLELALGTELIGVKAGWRPFERARAAIFHVVETGKSREKGLGLDGIREWQATKGLYGAEEQVATELLTRPPARWEDVPEHIASIYQFLESGDFSIDELQIKMNQSIQLLEAVPVTTKKSQEMRERLVSELEAVRAFHSFRISMERGDMNPEKVTGVFETYFTNETWKNFVDRFDHDVRQRQFIDKDGNPVNLFDEAQKLYFRRLQTERVRMNKIQEMTRRGLDLDSSNPDELWIIKWMTLKQVLSDLGKELNDAEKVKNLERVAELKSRIKNLEDIKKEPRKENALDKFFETLSGEERQDRLKRINGVWCTDEDFNKKLYCDTEAAINDWYEQNTLLGALGHIGQRRGEMQEELRDRLIELGLKVKDEKGTETALVDELGQEESEISNFLRSVDFNAYNFSWTMAWSDFDGIRIYGRDGKDPERIRAYAFNQSSHMFFGRHIDHVWEFFTNERRGREAGEDEVNEIIRKKFPGKHHNLFPSNRTMVRFTKFFASDAQLAEIGRRAQRLMNQIDFKHPNPEYNSYFQSWAENVVTAEMIDSGELDFTAKNFSDTAGGMKKYEMSDLFYDRQYNLNYLKRENFQAYMRSPTNSNFKRINDADTIFYSGRDFRLFPWMELAFRAHWEVQSKHMQRLFNKLNMSAASAEELVEVFIANGVMERKQGEKIKRDLFGLKEVAIGGSWGIPRLGTLQFTDILGTTPFRRLRQWSEAARRLSWEAKWLPLGASLAGIWEAIIAFFKQLPKELSR